jgi:hypothetical protein
MADREIKTCVSCPAYYPLISEAGAGLCRCRPPVALSDKDFFRGSTRSMLFGAYPIVGGFPLVREHDYCMEHPENRGTFMHGGPVVVPHFDNDDDGLAGDVDHLLGEEKRRATPPPGSSM